MKIMLMLHSYDIKYKNINEKLSGSFSAPMQLPVNSHILSMAALTAFLVPSKAVEKISAGLLTITRLCLRSLSSELRPC